MKNSIPCIGFFIAILFCFVECSVLLDVPYGENEQQVLDLYVPEDDSIRLNKIIIMIHGGAWWMGRKEDLNPDVAILRAALPDYAIANINYQLGSEESPGFPKQLDDIKAVIAFLKSSFTTDLSFAVFGVSAGAHLAMLYSYWWDRNNRDVKVVVSHVGPVDFMDDGYCRNILLYPLIVPLIGPHPCAEFPEIWNQTSPINYIEEATPPTIGFYGNLDILVPFGQMPALQGRLESVGVANEFTRYQGGHNGWPDTSIQDMYRKITDFLQVHM
ncbi:uncharacterized protein LOC110849932 [Folsomia candida]|uniref:Kynurenine formamidase n=1 Tax=Folsomia candida TaxID=158441 RepID=A0A226ECA8_FOLCA|nr:uncharacterized protein LOC110849932 [Folsomia candida]OXA54326.1 Kynurenine formamidase [Folsomia candida]